MMEVLDWPENFPDLNPIENRVIEKNKIAEKQTFNAEELVTAITVVFVKEMSTGC